MQDKIEDWVILLVRVGAITVHFLEFAGLTIGATVAFVLLTEEILEIYKDHKLKKKVREHEKRSLPVHG